MTSQRIPSEGQKADPVISVPAAGFIEGQARPAHTPTPLALIDALRARIRAIELRVDNLNVRGFKQKPDTQAALDAIKEHCRAALKLATE